MGKDVLFLCAIAFAILVCGNVFAISTTLKNSYTPSETIIVEVLGNILQPIKIQDVVFKRGHVAMAPEYDVKKLADKYFIWAIAPSAEGNYTLAINNIATTVSGQVKAVNFEQGFSVSGNMTGFSIKPGVILTDKDFELTAFLNEDIQKTIQINFVSEREVTLKPGENLIKFSIGSLNGTGLFNLTIGSYVVPVYIIANKTDIKENLTEENATETSEGESEETTSSTNATREEISEPEFIPAETLPASSDYCISLRGVICGKDQSCSGTGSKSVSAKDGLCCIGGQCATPPESSGSSWIGYLIAAIVLIGIGFLWFKYKKTKPGKTAIEKAAGK